MRLESIAGGGANQWHTDVTFVDRPPKASDLRAVELPPYGGTTTWASTVAAYQQLPQPLKELAENLWAVHNNAFDYAQIDPAKLAGGSRPRGNPEVRVSIPLDALRDAASGSAGAPGIRREVSAARLIRQVLRRAQRRRIPVRCTGSSRIGSLGWRTPFDGTGNSATSPTVDNRATQHYAVSDFGNQRRTVHRITLAGDIPVSVHGERAASSPAMPATTRLSTLQTTRRLSTLMDGEVEPMGLLETKVAVVTGANSGIGLATAERFIAEGAERVFITGRRQAQLGSAAAQLGPRAVPVPGDVGKPADLDRLYTEVAAAGRGLDIVVANAGSTRVARLGEISDDDLDTVLTTNVKVWSTPCRKRCRCSMTALPSSCSDPPPRTGDAGAEHLCRVESRRAITGARLGQRTRRPRYPGQRARRGSTATPGSDNLATQTNPNSSVEEFRAARISTIPLGRFAESVEIANAAVFLASDLSSFTTGSTVTADGGFNQV